MFITMGLVYKPELEAEKVLGNVGGGRLEADAGERVPLERFLEARGSTSVESFHAVALGFKGPWKLRERGPAAPQSLSPLTANPRDTHGLLSGEQFGPLLCPQRGYVLDRLDEIAGLELKADPAAPDLHSPVNLAADA